MTALLLDPHGDDVALFAAYSLLAHDPLPFVLVTHRTVPYDEVNEAFTEFGCFWGEGWPPRDNSSVDVVYAPEFREDGHYDHNQAAGAAVAEYGRGRVRFYATYAPRGQRTRTDNEVPAEPWMIARKLRALSCFVSQIEQESTRPWFTSLLDLREWYAS